ncbi:MAG TPA: CPBP family intramembrane glutamic endopeptidase [bacterium]
MSDGGHRSTLRIALLVYLPMLASGLWLRAPGTLRIADPVALAWGLLAAAAIGAAVVAGSRRIARRTGWGRRLHAEFHAILGRLESRQILLLSLLSGFGEEVLFRGVLQPRLGLWPASLLFAALHFPARRALLPWTAFALGIGLVLGLLTEWAGSLWPAIVLHFLINYFNLHDLAEPPSAPERPGPQAG